MRRSTVWALAAVLLTLLIWGWLAWLARIEEPWAITLKRDLFGWAVLELLIAVAVLVVALAHQKKKIAAFRVVVVGVTLVLSVGMLEGTAALHLLHWKLLLERAFGEDGNMAWDYDPDRALGWKRRPNAKWQSPSISDIEGGWSMRPARYLMQTFTYDAYGFRNPRTVPHADVVLMGDSYIEGANADDDEVVARRLEARLGTPVESMGVAGYGTLQNLITLDKDSPKLDPKVAVFFFFEGNDLYDDWKIEAMWRIWDPDYRPSKIGMARFQDWAQRSFVRNMLRYTMRWADPILPNHAPFWGDIKIGPRKGERVLFADYAAIPWSDFVAERWTIALAAMKKAADMERARGVKPIFVFTPIKERVYWPYVDIAKNAGMEKWTFWPIRDDFAKFCRDENVACIDLTEPFERDIEAGNMPYLPTDTHWSARGHELVAERLAALIEDLIPLSAPGGGEGRSEVGETPLLPTSPGSLRSPPSPPDGRRGS